MARASSPGADVLLAVGAELGPVGRDGVVVVEEPAIGEPVDDRRGDALGGREAEGERVPRPGAPAVPVGHAGPDVDEVLATPPHDERAAAVAAAEHALEGLRHRLEARADAPLP